VLRHDPGMLRVLRDPDEGRLQLLHDDEWDARLLRLLSQTLPGENQTTRVRTIGRPGFCY